MEQQTRRKVLHIITKGSPLGGAQKYVLTLASKLPSERFESVVAIGQGDELSAALHEKGIRTLRLPSLGRDINAFGDIQTLLDLIHVIRKESPDIVHLNSSKIGGLGAAAVRIVRLLDPQRNIRSVFTGHAWAFNEDRPLLVKNIILFSHWLTIMLADVTIAVSEKTRQDVAGLPFIQKKIVAVYSGIEPFTTIARDEARDELSNHPGLSHSIPKDTIWIGTLSELHPNKGLDLAIAAIGRLVKNTTMPTLPKFSFLIFGGGAQKEALLEQIQTLGLEKTIFLLGPTPNAKKYLAAFDIFSLTSRTEALPLSILEAGMCALPCIATYVGGIPEIIRNGVSGILVEPTVDSMEKGYAALLRDPEKGTEYGQNLQKKIATSLSVDTMITRVIDIYRR